MISEPRSSEPRSLARGGGQSVHIMTMAVERIEELEKALNDLLNDCINFNGGTLTNCILEQASAALNIERSTR